MRKSVSVQNMSDKQYEWLKKRAEDAGVGMSNIIKLLIQDAMEAKK